MFDVNFAIVLLKLVLVKPIEHNELDVEEEISMGDWFNLRAGIKVA
jgi:hypothetical protein